MTNLITRLEAASSPDRELDAEIMCLLREAQVRDGTLYKMNRAGSTHELVYTPTPYTASIDAALTLVPEGCLWTMDSWQGPDRFSCGIWTGSKWLVYADKRRTSPTPALAICIAALKAREASNA